MVILMKIKDFLGSTVLDKNAYEVGKIDNVDFDVENGTIGTVTLTLQKTIFSKDELEINFDDIQTIGAYVLLNKEIVTETDDDETVEVEIENE